MCLSYYSRTCRNVVLHYNFEYVCNFRLSHMQCEYKVNTNYLIFFYNGNKMSLNKYPLIFVSDVYATHRHRADGLRADSMRNSNVSAQLPRLHWRDSWEFVYAENGSYHTLSTCCAITAASVVGRALWFELVYIFHSRSVVCTIEMCAHDIDI